MSELGHVFDSLKAMSLLQLLLAFIACTGYVLAQGGLVGARGRRASGVVAAMAAVAFTILASDWMAATMLVAFAVAGLGVFVAAAWLLSRSVALPGGARDSDAAFVPSETDLDQTRPTDSGFVPPRTRRRRVQSA